jgi:ligand-binding sensor domain-containing protein/two-component sensor histidine kinase
MRSLIKLIPGLFFISACSQTEKNTFQESIQIFQDPFIVPLDTANGYAINPLTGDSIKPIINSFGDTIITGKRTPFNGEIIQPTIISSTISTAQQPVTTFIETNYHPLTEKPKQIIIDTARLKKIPFGKGDSSFVLRDKNKIIPTGVPIPTDLTAVPCKETRPVKALPLRRKDGATEDIQYLDVEQGLGFSYITTFMKDSRDNFWLGTDGLGITKYNGISFTNYSEKEGLNGKTINRIREDSKGNLWIASETGITIFDGRNFFHFSENNLGSSANISDILEDKKGNIWYCFYYSVAAVFDGKNTTIIGPREGLPPSYNCIEDRKGNIWFATKTGLVKFNGSTFTYFTQEDGLPDNVINSLMEDRKGNLWITFHKNGIAKLDGNILTHYTVKDTLADNEVKCIREDRKGNIWLGTISAGLVKFDGKNFVNYSREQGLSKNKVIDIVEDDNGNIWSCVEGGGVNRLNTSGFSYIIPEKLHDNSKVRPIINDHKGYLWLGTEAAGIGKYNLDKNTFDYYVGKKGNELKGQRALLEDKAGKIWISSNGTGVYQLYGTTLINYVFPGDDRNNAIFSMLQDKQNDFWFSDFSGAVLRFNGKEFTRYNEKNELWADRVYTIMQDKKGNIWFCSKGGLIKYDGAGVTCFSEKQGLGINDITCIMEDENGDLWFGSLGAGLCRFDGTTFFYYTDQQGLSNNNVWSVFEDSMHRIWVGTDHGLNLLVRQNTTTYRNFAVYNFGLQDGLRALDFNLHSVCVDNKNRIWWGTGKGTPTLDLNDEIRFSKPAHLSLNTIEINDRFYDFKNLPDSSKNEIRFTHTASYNNYPEELSLNYNYNHITFRYSAVDWSAPEKIKYSYRLIGLDDTWSNPTSDAFAEYRNLSHGKYEFQVKAIGQSQIWTEPVTYSFIITPAWWQTWWFKTGMILLGVLIVLAVFRFIYLYRLRRQKALLEKQLAIQYERQRISAEMHDDVGAGLSGIKLLTELAKKKITDEQAAAEIEKIHDSVGNISANMKEVIWSLDSDNDHLENLITFIQKQVRRLLEHYPCELSIIIPDKIPGLNITGNERRNIYLLVKEAIHNIIKHSGADKINLSISCNGNLTIVVSDNGKGLDTDKNNDTGNGMKNMRRRIQQLNGKIFIMNDKGLTLIFEIPLPATT